MHGDMQKENWHTISVGNKFFNNLLAITYSWLGKWVWDGQFL